MPFTPLFIVPFSSPISTWTGCASQMNCSWQAALLLVSRILWKWLCPQRHLPGVAGFWVLPFQFTGAEKLLLGEQLWHWLTVLVMTLRQSWQPLQSTASAVLFHRCLSVSGVASSTVSLLAWASSAMLQGCAGRSAIHHLLLLDRGLSFDSPSGLQVLLQILAGSWEPASFFLFLTLLCSSVWTTKPIFTI